MKKYHIEITSGERGRNIYSLNDYSIGENIITIFYTDPYSGEDGQTTVDLREYPDYELRIEEFEK
jgi:hypothetical protein